MKTSVSRLFAVTLFTPYRMVRSSLPCQRRGERGGERGEGRGERGEGRGERGGEGEGRGRGGGGEGRGGEGRGVGLCFHERLY